jgi:hypothetical protein
MGRLERGSPASRFNIRRLSVTDEAVELVRDLDLISSLEVVVGVVLRLCTLRVSLNLCILMPNSVYSGGSMMLPD